jgi:hypothetical protein
MFGRLFFSQWGLHYFKNLRMLWNMEKEWFVSGYL